MTKANLVLATSYSDGANFQKIGAKNIAVITNGFEAVKKEIQKDHHYFHITYSGGLEMLRNPIALWKAITALTSQNSTFKSDLKLNFYGSLAEDVKATIIANGLSANLAVHGYVSHQESLDAINQANVLVLTNFDDAASKGIIPGKLFEYMATQNPILAIGPEDADVEKILSKTKAGEYFNHQEVENIKKYILSLYNQWLVNPDYNFPTHTEEVNQFNRKNLTQRLAETIQNL